MLAHRLHFHRYEQLFRLGSLVLLSLTLLILLFSGFLYLTSLKDHEETLEFTALPRESLRGQAFVAATHGVFVPTPKIGERLQYLECNDRPDSAMKKILIGLKDSGEKRLISLEERVYFRCRDLLECEFSNEPTPYWIEPKAILDNTLEVQFTTRYQEGERKLYEQSSSLGVNKVPSERKEDDSFTQLASMKVYPPDRLIDLYGGATFEEEKGRYRVEMGEKQKQIFYVKEGDLIVFHENRWKEQKETLGLPLLMVKGIDNQKCDYVLWSGDGFSSRAGTFSVERPLPPTLKSTELFSKVYPRTDSSVTCQLNQKNMILREGDWLVKTKGGWRNLHTLSEIKKLLAFGMSGELFVFDGVQKREGNTYFVGHLFDEKRAHAQRVELVLSEKKHRKISKKKVNSNG